MHGLVRATNLPDIIRRIMDQYQWSEDEALRNFYLSATGANFSDDETGLYGQSSLYIFSLFAEEMSEDAEHEDRR